MNDVQKAAVSVSEMARMLSLSRSRFYQLISEGVFPKPNYEPSTKRPFYDEEAQRTCLEVRRRNCGVNGKPVLFYPSRNASAVAKTIKGKVKPTPASERHELIDSLACLGLNVTTRQIEAALRECYPNGVTDTDERTIVRTLFLYLKRQEPRR